MHVARLALIAAAAAAVAGCGGGGKTVAVCKQGTKVHLAVLRGDSRSTLALVPIRIDGKGPFVFALDTGASKSAINDSLAKRLGLKKLGSAGPVQGIASSEPATVVAVHDWEVGGVKLHPDRIAALNLFPDTSKGPQGLLGSDALSRFQSVCIDYHSHTLRLGTG